MSWGGKRKSTIILVALLIVAIPIAIYLFDFFNRPPSCFDKKQNQGEEGIDCGGPCTKLCGEAIIEPLVIWKRFFRVAPGVYTLGALIENQNAVAMANDAEYTFELYKDEALLERRSGRIDLNARSFTPIIESNVTTGQIVPNRIEFSLKTENVDWQRQEELNFDLLVTDERIVQLSPQPRIDAVVTNTSLETIRDAEIAIVLTDSRKNVMGISKTFISEIASKDKKNIVFTWPTPFEDTVANIDIIPLN